MTHESSPSAFEYDVALSFASEDKATVEKLIHLLMTKGIRVFRDEYAGPDSPGTDLIDHLVNLYARKACYCVLLISRHYPLKSWTEVERTAARERALRDADEYILLLQLDDVGVPGITTAKGYRDMRDGSVENVVGLLEEKLATSQNRSGPSKSHDLRSGNVPSQGDV
jgi:hypothetical protein